MRKFLLMALAITCVFAACKKTDFDDTVTGEAVGSLALLSPGKDSFLLNPATPNRTIVFQWTPAKPGVDAAVKYRVIFAAKTAANFDSANRLFQVPSDNGGANTTLTLTYKQMDDLLKAAGFSAEARAELQWTVEAYNEKGGATLATASNIIILKRTVNGATPFNILAPASSSTPITLSPGSTTDSLTFRWTRAVPATGSPAVTYKVNIYKDDNSTAPLFTLSARNNGLDTLRRISHKDFSDSLTKYGFTNLAQAANLRWEVVATSGTWVQAADFTNQLYIVREVKLFLVGGATPIGWTPTDALRLREDITKPGVFYIYTRLTTGNNGFKLLSMKADWNAQGQVEYGENNGADGSGNNPANNTGNLRIGGVNIAVPASGVYRVTVDLNTNKYYLQSATANGIGGMGMIGGFQGWSQPAVKMDYVTVNRFNYLTTMNSGEIFKFHDGNAWDNSTPSSSRWFGLNGTTLVEDGGSAGNITYTGATGLVRAIWDATDVTNLRYTVIPGKLYAIGGDANLGNWNNSPGNASMPEFTYLGNGQWTATITVSSGAPFKLVMEKGNWDMQWGAGATAGTMQNRYYDADPSTFNFPAAGTYTVVVDEYNATISW